VQEAKERLGKWPEAEHYEFIDEAATGFEPVNGGFQTNMLWVLCRSRYPTVSEAR